MSSLKNFLNKAISRREKMFKTTNALRLVNGRGDHLRGLLIDRYNKHIHVQMLHEDWHKHIDEIHRFLTCVMPVDYLIVKTRRGLQMQVKTFVGTNPETIIEEHGLKFKVNLNSGLNCGLFLDMRRNRWMVGRASKHAKVLICFAYTCAFGVYARAGGAREVINTDISGKILERGRDNYLLNGFLPATGEFVKTDSVAYLKRALKKGSSWSSCRTLLDSRRTLPEGRNCFDVIVLDPPSFARCGTQVFQVKRDLPKLIAWASAVLNPAGKLLISTNYSEISYTDLEGMLARSLNGRRVQHIQRIGQDIDFTGSNSFKESFLVGLWVKFH